MHKREVIVADALVWLKELVPWQGTSLVASLPDISEFPNLKLEDWKSWFIKTASLVLTKTPPRGVTIFYQSDIKHDGEWVDKAYLCQKAAELEGHRLLWHKIACRVSPEITTFGRPAYSHMICFSRELKIDLSKGTPDVLGKMGEKTWERGMGLGPALLIAKFIKEQTDSHTIINPFCGHGSMLAAANALGLNATGIERSPKRAEKARALKVSEDLKYWIES